MMVQFHLLAWDNLSRECLRKVLPIRCSLLRFHSCPCQCADSAQKASRMRKVNILSCRAHLQPVQPTGISKGVETPKWDEGRVPVSVSAIWSCTQGDFCRQPCNCCYTPIPNQLFKQYLEQILELFFRFTEELSWKQFWVKREGINMLLHHLSLPLIFSSLCTMDRTTHRTGHLKWIIVTTGSV